MGIAADMLVAGFNPQLAAWSHNPFAAEVERTLVQAFGERFGWRQDETEGTFASGGAEANHTALLVALGEAFPEFSTAGPASDRGSADPLHLGGGAPLGAQGGAARRARHGGGARDRRRRLPCGSTSKPSNAPSRPIARPATGRS
jgi:hypothetical protein